MKIKSFFIALFFIGNALIAFSQNIDLNTDDTKIALEGYSPVSYIDLRTGFFDFIRKQIYNRDGTV